MAPTRRVRRPRRKMPTTSVRRLISPITRFSGFGQAQLGTVLDGEGLNLVHQRCELGHPHLCGERLLGRIWSGEHG
jgi:hypothetical protein